MSFRRKLLPAFLALLILLWAVPEVPGTRIDIAATADSFTSNINPDANYGGSEFLDSHYYMFEISGQNFTQEYVTWLKFDLSVIPSNATVSSIILRLHTSMIGPAATNKIGVFPCPDSNWQEMTITWHNSPQVTGPPIATEFVSRSDTDYDFDVTSAVKGRINLTFVLKTIESTSSVGFASFYSREKLPPQGESYYPRFIVEYSSSSLPSRALDPVLWLPIFVAILAVMVFAACYVIRRRQQPSKTPANRRGLIRVCCYSAYI